MSLPPALLAKLQKRGIVKGANEEIIAENYDSQEGGDRRREIDASGAPGCPNKYNEYHICTDYCYDHWREGIPEDRLSDRYLRKRRRMLGKYPLPEGWTEVYDCGVARHYYWNMDTDEVCWVSPRHPRAYITEAAPRIARAILSRERRAAVEISDRERTYSSRDSREEYGRGRERELREPPRAPPSRRRRNSENSDREGSDTEDIESMNDRDRVKRAKRKGIDPMDPAAYGDAPVGNWASGLRAHDKTGADVTASGPLFQQRPYPAPGAILRQQKKARGEDDD